MDVSAHRSDRTPAPGPTTETTRAPVLRGVLGALLSFGALNAFGGGAYGLAGAPGVPTEWLEGTPFANYFIPSLLLVVVVGGSLALAAAAVFARWRTARVLAIAAGAILLGWLAVQVCIIGPVSWLQLVMAIVAPVILALAWWLPRRRAVG
jgi:hypothetical protein